MTTSDRRRSLRPTRLGRRRLPVAFVAWGAVAGRSSEIAESLGGGAYALYPPVDGKRPNVAVRYVVGSVLTLIYLAREDPMAIVVTNPPAVLGLVALAWAWHRDVPLVLDSHPGAFGKQGDRVSALLLPVHRYLARRAAVTLVTAEPWVETVRSWGGRALVLHEAPGEWTPCPQPRRTAGRRIRALLVARFGGDEPIAAALEAAALLPELDLLVTGRLGDCPPGLLVDVAPNVSFVGFLPAPRYRELVRDADVIVSLTTEPTSVMRAAYEAVYACKPLVISNWPLSQALFPFAVAVTNDPSSIASGLRRAVSDLAELHKKSCCARRVQIERWESQLHALQDALALSNPPVPGVVREGGVAS
ncbi:MAG: glycosyltransferase [Acidimicrobiales bacterium]